MHPLRRPHLPDLKEGQVVADNPSESAPENGGSIKEDIKDSNHLDAVAHEFTLRVCGVRGLEVESGMVWGKADCYVQYHFPTLTRSSDCGEYAANGKQQTVYVCVCVCKRCWERESLAFRR